MKKNLIVATFAVASVLSAASAFADDGQVKFTGSIVDPACEVGNTVTSPLEVTLGEVAKTAFGAKAGTTAAATQFTLVLKNCPATLTSATVKFDGPTAAGDDSVLALTSGGATGVGIQISDSTQKVLPLSTESSSYPLLSTGDNELQFVARYISTSATVVSGQANAVANFTINYN